MKINSVFKKLEGKYIRYQHNLLENLKYRIKIKKLKKQIGKIVPFTKTTHINDKTVAIIEPNPFHAETIPGYIKYFIDLGYNIDVFLTIESAYEKPFILMPQKFRLFIGEQKNIQEWVRYKNMINYSVIFFNTLIHNATLKFMPSLLPYGCKKIIGVEHSKEAYAEWLKGNHDYEELKSNGMVSTLSYMENYKHINPNYFGCITVNSKNSDKIIFVVIGSISRLDNIGLLLNAVLALKQSYNNSFEVHIIGSGHIDIPIGLQQNIKHLGRLDFPSMYKELEKSDYILAMLDPLSPLHLTYLNGTTSGSIQLSLGFCKPLIINSIFAEKYILSNKEAIIYEDSDLYKAMKISIEMTNEKYNLLQQCIEKLRSTIYNESLESIKKMIQ